MAFSPFAGTHPGGRVGRKKNSRRSSEVTRRAPRPLPGLRATFPFEFREPSRPAPLELVQERVANPLEDRNIIG
jgi:hypothetical protein